MPSSISLDLRKRLTHQSKSATVGVHLRLPKLKQKARRRTLRLEDMPSEVLARILDLLPVPQMLLWTRVSRRFSNVITQTDCLQLRIEAYVAGLALCAAGTDTTPGEMIKGLRQTQQNWSTFSMNRIEVLAFPDLTSFDSIRVSGGVLMHSVLKIPDFPEAPYYDTIRLTQLPNTVEVPAYSWFHEDLGFQFSDMLIDASQDVIIMMHLEPFEITTSGSTQPRCLLLARSLLDNRVKSRIDFEIPAFYSGIKYQHAMGVRTYGILFTYSSQSLLVIWNFETGNIVCQLGPEAPEEQGFNPNHLPLTSFTFLNDRSCVVAQSRGSSGVLWTVSFDPDELKPIHYIQFLLPDLIENVVYKSIHFQQDCAPSRGAPTNAEPVSPGNDVDYPQPYQSSHAVPQMKDSLIVMYLVIGSPHLKNQQRLTLFVHARQFLVYTLQTQGGSLGVPPGKRIKKIRSIPWSEWHEGTVRVGEVEFFEPGCEIPVPTAILHGQRYVLYTPPAYIMGGGIEEAGIVIMDFNERWWKRKARAKVVDETTGGIPIAAGALASLVTMPCGFVESGRQDERRNSVWRQGSIFSLPYRRITFPVARQPQFMCMDDERIMIDGSEVDASGNKIPIIGVHIM